LARAKTPHPSNINYIASIKYVKVDADTGEEVPNEDITKGYKVDTDTYVEVSKDELENIALESTRTIDIDEFVPKSDIDPRYLTLRETIRGMDKVAIGRVVLTSREHIIGLEPLEKGLMGTLLRYPYEVRDEKEYFDDIQDVKVTKDMLDLAKHIADQRAADFDPEKFEDHYEEALTELINAKRNGKTVAAKPRPRGENVVDLMDALKKSLASETAPPRARRPERHPPAKRRCSCRSRGRSVTWRRRRRPNPRGQLSARLDSPPFQPLREGASSATVALASSFGVLNLARTSVAAYEIRRARAPLPCHDSRDDGCWPALEKL
jgi:DNA end-binding protein Ku